MGSILRKTGAATLAVLVASAPAGAADWSSDNVLEARLGGERLILRQKPATSVSAPSGYIPAAAMIPTGQAVQTDYAALSIESALANTTDGSTGLISFWINCSPDSTYISLTCHNAGIMSNYSNISVAHGEGANGLTIVMDNSGSTAPSIDMRFNVGRSVAGKTTAGTTNTTDFGATLTNAWQAGDYAVWTHFLIAWDSGHAAGHNCIAIYKNGIAQSVAPYDTPAGSTGVIGNWTSVDTVSTDISYNWSFGIAPINNGTVAYPSGFGGVLSEVYVNFGASVCQNYGNGSYSSYTGTVSSTLLQSFVSGSGQGNVTPVNLGPTCSLPTGTQPQICPLFNGNSTTNRGNGGAFVSNYAATGTAAQSGVRNVVTTPGGFSDTISPAVKWSWQKTGSETPSATTLASGGGTESQNLGSILTAQGGNTWGGRTIAVGDVLVLAYNYASSSAPGSGTTFSASSSWGSPLYSWTAAQSAANYGQFGVWCHVVASASETFPTIVMNAPVGSGPQSFVLLDYANASGCGHSSYNQTPSNVSTLAAPTFTTQAANSTILFIGEDYLGQPNYSVTATGLAPTVYADTGWGTDSGKAGLIAADVRPQYAAGATVPAISINRASGQATNTMAAFALEILR